MFELQVAPQTSTDGVATLSWKAPQGQPVQLQWSHTADFEQHQPLYRGNDSGTTVTGLEDGKYYFRVGVIASSPQTTSWSETVELQVAHHALGRAFGFFGLGLVVFLATLGLIIDGSRRNRGTSR